ncbi:MAG: tetratricopeptide repeat protein, partial [Tumebacillaceae bacterium]
IERLEDENEPDDHFLAVLTDKLGTAYYFISQLENSYAFYMRAYQISKRFPEHDPVSAKIAFNLGKILRMIDRPNEAIDHLIRAEEYFNQVSDLKKQAITLFELGLAYQIRGNIEQADAIILKALALYESLNLVKMARRVRESHAYTVLSERKPTRAIEVLIECALEYEQDGDRLNLVYTYSRIAFLLLRKGDNDRALHYVESAMNLFSEGEAANHFEYVTAYHAYAEYLLQVKRFDECIQYSSKASEIFATMGLDSDATDSLKLAVQAYRLQGNFEMALNLSEQSVEILHKSRNRF